MKIIDTIKKKIASRRERKAIMKLISITNGKIVINADVVVKGTITGK